MLIVHLVHAFCFHGSAVSHPCRASKQSIVNRESKNVAGIMPISPDSHVARQRCGKGSCLLILHGQAHLHAPTCPCARCGPKTKGGTRKKHASRDIHLCLSGGHCNGTTGELLGGRKNFGLSQERYNNARDPGPSVQVVVITRDLTPRVKCYNIPVGRNM